MLECPNEETRRRTHVDEKRPRDRSGPAHFDLGVVATAVRNAGIIMSDLCGCRDFSPSAPLRLPQLSDVPTLPLSRLAYEGLSACRRASERGAPLEGTLPQPDDVAAMLVGLRAWLYGCLECAEARGR